RRGPCLASSAEPSRRRPGEIDTMTKRLAVLTLLLLASVASAGPLLRSKSPDASGITRALDLDHGVLAELRTQRTDVLESFPLGADGTATLALHRVEPFSPTLRIEVDTPGGVKTIPPPDAVYFGGTVVGEARSLVLLIAAPDSVRGFVMRGDATYPFGPDRHGMLRSYALRDVDAGAHPGPSDFCANDLHPERALTVPAPRAAMAAPLVTAHTSTVLEAQVAIDTDTELLAKFSNNQTAATNYVTALFAAANVIYENDVQVRLKLNYLRLRTGSDPWTGTDTIDALDELQSYWLASGNGMPNAANDIVHFISGKSVQGGVAYIQAACDNQYHFGVSQVFGDFDVSDPNGIWDVLVFTHEVGHNMGTQHTHCYSPPV